MEPDAILSLSVQAVDLHLPEATPTYCGIKDDLYWPAKKIGFVDYVTQNRPTLARALCLSAHLYDMEERELYAIRGGLELFQTFAWQKRATRPVGERLRNLDRLERVYVVRRFRTRDSFR